jgi:hypothetical protein
VGPNDNNPPDGMAIRFYTVGNMYVDPQDKAAGTVSPAIGPSVTDLVNAVLDHPDWTTDEPVAVNVGGYDGQRVHVTLPESTSEVNRFYLFTDPTGGDIWGWDPTQSFDVYIVDVAGERLVFDAFHFAETTQADLDAQQAVIDSIQIEPAP